MNPEQLLQYFECISEAEDAVPRLRRFVLDLAVRGKLVEQDPEEEQASILLARIANERQSFLERGLPNETEAKTQLRKHEQQIVPPDLESLPSGWEWATLMQCANLVVDCHNKTAPYAKSGIPLLRTSNIRSGTLVLDDLRYVSEATFARWSARCEPVAGDILITREAPMGEVARIPEGMRVCMGQRMMLIRLVPGTIDPHFLLYSLRDSNLMDRVQDKPVGATVQHLRVKGVETLLVPLPPPAEQHRIVAKVDELMVLCDELEAAQAKRETRRDRLVAATLHGLNNGDSTFKESTRFYFNHLPRLTTRTEHVQQLRQTILNLAVRGKLVPQAPEDESAHKLLQKINAEKLRLLQSRDIGKRKSILPSSSKEFPFDLPEGWVWVCFDQLILDADSGWSPKCEVFPRSRENWGVIKVSAVSWDEFRPNENKQLLGGSAPRENAKILSGDFLISRANTSELVAKCVVVRDEPKNLMMSDKIVRLRLASGLSKDFLRFVNNHADYARSYYATRASGTSLSMKNVSREIIYKLLIPLPSLAEQHRIVAKVDELMTLCDELEAQLTTTATTRRQLLEATLHEALAVGT